MDLHQLKQDILQIKENSAKHLDATIGAQKTIDGYLCDLLSDIEYFIEEEFEDAEI